MHCRVEELGVFKHLRPRPRLSGARERPPKPWFHRRRDGQNPLSRPSSRSAVEAHCWASADLGQTRLTKLMHSVLAGQKRVTGDQLIRSVHVRRAHHNSDFSLEASLTFQKACSESVHFAGHVGLSKFPKDATMYTFGSTDQPKDLRSFRPRRFQRVSEGCHSVLREDQESTGCHGASTAAFKPSSLSSEQSGPCSDSTS